MLALFEQRRDTRGTSVERHAQFGRRRLGETFREIVGIVARAAFAGERLDAAHAGRHAGFAHHRDDADIAGAIDMGAAAQLDRPAHRIAAALAHRDDAHFIAVFLAEQRARA